MDELTREAVYELICARQEIPLKGLYNNVKYMEINKRQDDNAKEVMEIIKKLDKESDQKKVQDYYDDEIHKFLFELDEVYIRGFKDCYKLIEFLKDDEIKI